MQDVDKFKSQMNSLAYGNAMMAAARDYQAVRLSASDGCQAPRHSGCEHAYALCLRLPAHTDVTCPQSEPLPAMQEMLEEYADSVVTCRHLQVTACYAGDDGGAEREGWQAG